MIRRAAQRASAQFNSLRHRTKVGYLLLFCLLFLLLLYSAISLIQVDPKNYTSRVPAHIGRTLPDKLTHQKR